MAAAACDICAEKLNKTNHRPIECPRHACRAVSCSSCVETYLVGLMTAGQCMHCRVEYDPMWLRRHMTASFMSGTYKRHREHVLMEHEKSLIPRTMPIIESARRIGLLEEVETKLKQKLVVLKQKLQQTSISLHRLRRERDRSLQALEGGANQPPPVGVGEDEQDEQDPEGRATVHYLRPCARDDCPGYVNSRTGNCPTCEGTTCVKCNIPLPLGEQEGGQAPHECLPVDIEQWNLIRSSTRPCPGCRTRITKAAGCDQMWCPQCHTAFRWSTGEIERGAIHNPHYYEWMFGGRAPAALNAADDQENRICNNPGELPGVHTVRRSIDNKRGEGNETQWNLRLTNIHQRLLHNHHTAIPAMRRNVGSEDGFRRRKTEHRLQYLTKKMTQIVFQTQLFRLDKAHRKTMEHNRILETFNVLAAEAFHGFCRTPTMSKKDLLDTLTNIQTISNEGIRDINHCYKSQLGYISIPGL